ncbi:protein lin-54 homolog [Watersipora subatra]|uniref:protein lin-54 homolog n=1 Tax=Watersipora subatra TaxID=2589382 RepID=UPI00355B8190
MSQASAMEVDEERNKPATKKDTIVIPRSAVKVITSSNVGTISTNPQSRVIQTVPSTLSSTVAKPPKLQIVKLVTAPGQQQMLKIQGAPVRVVGVSNATTRIQIAPSHSTTAVSSALITPSVQPAKVITSQRLILPASSKPLAPQLLTIPVCRSTGGLPSVLPTGSTVFSSSNSTNQVVAFLSPHKSASTAGRTAQAAQESTTPATEGFVKLSTVSELAKSELTPVKKEATSDGSQRKPCNCTKSHCLKLYCDCFAKGEFCSNCNCVNCANILSKEDQRQKAIKQCLLRNPNAFHPKIGKGESAEVRRHQKGCNCKRSGCLKNYCECFEARIMCGTMCKCVGCKNCEKNSSNAPFFKMADAAVERSLHSAAMDRSALARNDVGSPSFANKTRDSMQEHLSTEVIEGVLDCLLMQCREAESARCKYDTSEKLVLEEFGRCLSRIIQSATEGGS